MSFFLIFTKAFCLLCIAHAVAGGLDDKKEFNKHHVFLCYIFGVGGLFFDYFSIGRKTPWEGSVIKFNFI